MSKREFESMPQEYQEAYFVLLNEKYEEFQEAFVAEHPLEADKIKFHELYSTYPFMFNVTYKDETLSFNFQDLKNAKMTPAQFYVKLNSKVKKESFGSKLQTVTDKFGKVSYSGISNMQAGKTGYGGN